MMLQSLAARVLLMRMDHNLPLAEAVTWVTHRLPTNMQRYYRTAIHHTLRCSL
jgi:hypothetical protein